MISFFGVSDENVISISMSVNATPLRPALCSSSSHSYLLIPTALSRAIQNKYVRPCVHDRSWRFVTALHLHIRRANHCLGACFIYAWRLSTLFHICSVRWRSSGRTKQTIAAACTTLTTSLCLPIRYFIVISKLCATQVLHNLVCIRECWINGSSFVNSNIDQRTLQFVHAPA